MDTRRFKVIIEKHRDGYVAYPVGMNGAVVAEGDTYEEAFAEVQSAIAEHIETFGEAACLDEDEQPLEVFVAEVSIDALVIPVIRTGSVADEAAAR